MSYIAERRQEEKDRRRAEIVDAAIELYREVGWDAVTMDSVARRARLSRALVYVYFKDKADLHLAIAIRALELLRDRFEEASARERRGLDKVSAIGRAYIAFAHEMPHFFDACARLEAHHAAGSAPSEQEQTCVMCGTEVHNVVTAALQTGQGDGSIRSDVGDLDVTARVLWGFIHGIIQIAIRKADVLAQANISVPQLTDQAHNLIVNGLKAP